MSAVRLSGGPLRELRLHLCQTGASSAGARGWVSSQYVALKKASPEFPIRIRECAGIQPRLWARYAFGKEASLPLEGKTPEEVAAAVQSLARG